MSRLAALFGRLGLPGSRSGSRRNEILATVGYVLIAVALFGGYWYSAFLAVFALSVVFLATNAWGLRPRVPGFRSQNKLTATATWIGYAVAGSVVIGILTATVDAAHLAADRAAQAERTTAVTTTPAVGSKRSETDTVPPSARTAPPAASLTAPPTSAVPASSGPAFAIAAAPASLCAGRDSHDHVYNPDRLQVIDPCKTATGTVMFTRREADGDWHVGLSLDPGQESLLNAKNISDEQGDLVVEIICALPITQADAVSACANYSNAIAVPAIGARISVTGPYVLDTDHGWKEIHPVWAWIDLGAGAPASSGSPSTAAPNVVPGAPPASFTVTITSSRYGFVSAATTPGATCTAQARLPSGRISTAQGLQGSRTADASGNVAFTYGTTSRTTPGTGTHTVTCGYGGQTRTASASFTVP